MFAYHLEDPAKVMGLIEDLKILPCEKCRGLEADVQRLSDLRLGKQERRILLGAPGPDQPSRPIEPADTHRAAEEAHRRALRKLSRAGLVRMMPGQGFSDPSGRRRRRRAVQRTWLGQIIVEQLGDDLKAGKAIRWARHQKALLAKGRRSPQELLAQFRERVEAEWGHWALAAQMAQAIGWKTKGHAGEVEPEEAVGVLASVRQAIASP